MSSLFKRIWDGVWQSGGTPVQAGYPKSFPALPADERITRQTVFDPALQHYARGFRMSEPAFLDPVIGSRWFAARRRVLDHLTGAIASSAWKEVLVLRGSYLLQQWLHDAAREPGDLDWIIRPPKPRWMQLGDWGILNALTDLINQKNQIPGTDIRIGKTILDEIWTYDRVPGRRMLLSWTAGELPAGTAQMDFVINEELWDAPIETTFALPDQQVTLWTVSPEQSLASKLFWISSDTYPQGKDLYDATLLAERFPLPDHLWKSLLAELHRTQGVWQLIPPFIDDWDFSWEEFLKDYPDINGTEREFLSRLIAATEPAFMQHQRANLPHKSG